MKRIFNDNFLGFLLLCFFAIFVLDFLDLDNLFYVSFCPRLRVFGFSLSCSDFYDLPVWEVLVSLGTIVAGFFAYKAISQSNKQLELNNKPYLVIKDNLQTSGDKVLGVSFKNVSNALAANIKVTADCDGTILIGDSSNADSKDLDGGQSDHLAIDDNKLIQGLLTQDIKIDESTVKELIKLNLFLWYEDTFGNKYRTTSSLIKSEDIKPMSENPFIKVKNNLVERI